MSAPDSSSGTDGASVTYTKLLLVEKLGYPLWYPEPRGGAPDAHCRFGVRIGDVGNIDTAMGQFEFYFNVHEQEGCPPGFQVWEHGPEFPFRARSSGTVIERGAVTNKSFQVDATAP
jgi:hypothetical protein